MAARFEDITYLIYDQSEKNLNSIKKLMTPKKIEIIGDYGDDTLISLIKDLNNVNDEKTLIKWLEFATSHNYYCGSVWDTIYNEHKELEQKVKNIIKDNEYLTYLTIKADYSDIFLFKDSSELIEIEKQETPKITHALRYKQFLTLEQFNNIYHYNEQESGVLINEMFSISEAVRYFVDYDKIIDNLDYDEYYFSINNNKELIFDENSPELREF